MSKNKDVGVVKKVGGAAPDATPKPVEDGKKAKKVKKVVFDIKAAMMADPKGGKNPQSAIDEEGKLQTGMPIGFSFDQHKPIKKTAFGKTGYFLMHRAENMIFKGNKLVKTGEELKVKADRYVKSGDDKSAKAIKKAEKNVGALLDLQKQLAESGVDVFAILEEAKKKRAEEAKSAA